MTDPVSASVEATSRPHVAPSPLLPPDATERLARVIKVAFPHRHLPDGPYRRTAEHIIVTVSGNAFQTAQLGQGLLGLDSVRDRPFAELDPADALAVLEGISHTPFFALVRSTTVVFMYSDREVWDALGYEGESFDRGGYVDRGFDDLDWLPDPRIEELGA
jgi:hypothetical protein